MKIRQWTQWVRLAMLAAGLMAFLPAAPAAAQGVLRITVGTSLGTLDPARTSTGEEYIYDNLVFNGLTRMRGDLKIEPDLAQSWDYTPDLKS